jgi:membrane fusion protein, multidrug efflux system
MHVNTLIAIIVLALTGTGAAAAEIDSVPVRQVHGGENYVAEGVVEAVRQSVVSPQVAGRITQLAVKAGDVVVKGQLLVRIDAQAAFQQANANQAQVDAARAQLNVARRDFERQQQLYRKQYISQAALDQAEAQFKAAEASVRSLLAQAGAANTQTGFYTLSAPFSGTVAEVSGELGDMAMPGKALITLFEPASMRVVASLPQSRLAQLQAKEPVLLELPGLPSVPRNIVAQSVTILPTADAGTHTVNIRLGLPSSLKGALPGMFARAIFNLQGETRDRLMIPQRTVIRRTELDAVYVVGQGRALLRQVRLGKSEGDEIEVLAGLNPGERVALDPVAASRAQ